MNWMDNCDWVRVEKKSHQYVQAQRKSLTSASKDKFRKQVADEYGISFAEAKKQICHHVLPLSLGGRDNNHNRVLCDPYLEYLCHYFIDGQTEGMVLGSTRVILLPRFNGQLWRYDFG